MLVNVHSYLPNSVLLWIVCIYVYFSRLSIDLSLDLPCYRSTDRLIDRSIDRPIGRSTDRPIDGLSTDRLIDRPIDRPVDGPTDRSIDPSLAVDRHDYSSGGWPHPSSGHAPLRTMRAGARRGARKPYESHMKAM